MMSAASKGANAIAIIVLCTIAASAYGIIHDQFTVRICREYFTVFHPLIFGNQSSTILALLWGTIATWWIGTLLGFCLAVAACWGPAPMRSVRSLVLPIVKLLLIMAASAAALGLTGYYLVESGTTRLTEIYARRLPPNMYARFAANVCAHNASYLVGLFGGCVIVINVWKARRKSAEREAKKTTHEIDTSD